MKNTFILLSLLLISTLDSKALADKFNLTTAQCYDPEEDTAVDITQKWNIKDSGAISTSYCYDKDGFGYMNGAYVTSCRECLIYRCTYGTCPKPDGSLQYFMYWYLNSVLKNCCQDCEGAVYPTDHVMAVATMNDECKTKVTSECKYYDALSKDHGVVLKTYEPQDCCVDSAGLYPVDFAKLDPASCSIKKCAQAKPSVWFETPVFPGVCNCCVFNGTLVPEGGRIMVARATWANCCDGKLVVDYNISVPIDCSDPTAIYSSIGFSIDNTGSVGSSETGIEALSKALIEGIAYAGITIPWWVLTTFNDVSEDITDNTKLVIETSDSSAMTTAVNDIEYHGGGDAAERALQGLLLTLETLPKHNMVLVFTDNPSKNLELESELLKLRDEKMAKIFFVLAPKYHGSIGDPSWKVFNNLSDGRIYNMEDFNKTYFIDEVVTIIGDDCIASDPVVGSMVSDEVTDVQAGKICNEPKQGCEESEKICQDCNSFCQNTKVICEDAKILCDEAKAECDETRKTKACSSATKKCTNAQEMCERNENACDESKEECKITTCEIEF